MFSFNSGHQLPTLRQAERFWKNSSKGQLIIKFLSSLDETSLSDDNAPRNNLQLLELSEHDSGDRFMDAGNDYLLDIDFTNEVTERSEPGDPHDPDHQSNVQGMSVDFLKLFCLEKVFLSNYEHAKFDLALPALDYLQDLECTRHDVLRAAAERLGITKENWRHVLADNPNALAWVKDTENWNAGLEICYAELYVGLRIWIMVHELQTAYFAKENVLAILNTLFPPGVQRLPHRITPKVIHLLRSTFYRYLVLIEVNGVQILDGYIRKLEIPGNKYTWMKVRECVSDYIKYSGDIIQNARGTYGIKYLRNEDPSGQASFHTRCPEASSDKGCIRVNQQSMPTRLSSSSRSSSVKTDWINSSYHPINPRPRAPLVSTRPMNSVQNFIRPTMPRANKESETIRRDNSSLEARRRVLQEQRVTTLSTRPITSDDVILPGTPLLPDTLEVMNNYKFSISGNYCAVSPVFQRTPEFSESGQPILPCDGPHPRPRHPILNPKASFTKLLRKKISVGSSSTSHTLRDIFVDRTGLGISLGPSKSIENSPNFDPNASGSGRPILRKQPSLDHTTTNNSFRSRSGTVWALQSIDSRADALQCEPIEPSVLANNQIALKIKKKRSLPAIFTKNKSSPAITASPALKDSEPIYLKTDDDQELYVPLSELQPMQSILSRPRNKLWKAKSCNTLKSVTNSQATGNLTARNFQPMQSKKLVKTRSIGMLKNATGSQVPINLTPRWKMIQKTPKPVPSGSRNFVLDTPVPNPWSVKARQPLVFNWDPNSEDWKSREHTRQYYLGQHRAKQFGLNAPEGGPHRQTAPVNKESDNVKYSRTTPKLHTVKSNAQVSESIFPSRHTPKTPTEQKYTMIDINKYAKK